MKCLFIRGAGSPGCSTHSHVDERRRVKGTAMLDGLPPFRSATVPGVAPAYASAHRGIRFRNQLHGARRCRAARYTTLLRAIELWGAVQADGPRRLAGDEEPPPVDGLVVGREEDFSQQ